MATKQTMLILLSTPQSTQVVYRYTVLSFMMQYQEVLFFLSEAAEFLLIRMSDNTCLEGS